MGENFLNVGSDKAPKPNTIDNVLERRVHTFTELSGAAQLYAGLHFQEERTAAEALPASQADKKERRLRQLAEKEAEFAKEVTADIGAALVGFFSDYCINYVLPADTADIKASTGDVVAGLEAALKSHRQPGLDADEGVTRLVSKIVKYTYETADPRPYVTGVLEVLRGLPLGQLGSTPEKKLVEVNERTFRDRVSKLLTYGQRSSTTLMLDLLPEALPQMANAIRHQSQETYVGFLDEALRYIHDSYMEHAHSGAPVPTATEARAKLSKLEWNVLNPELAMAAKQAEATATVELQEKPATALKLRPKAIEDYAASGNLRSSLEQALGGTILAVDFTGHSSGVKRQLGFFVQNGNAQQPVRHTVSYASAAAPTSVVKALLKIQEECQKSLKPSDPLFSVNSRTGRTLYHLAE